MNYNDPELQRQLAGEYVLGMLQPRTRARFERLLRNDENLRAEVLAWQERLMPMAEALSPVTPPRRVWRGIQSRLGMRSPRFTGLAFWRGLSLISTAIAALLFMYLSLAPRMTTEAYVAVIADAQARPAWLVDARDGKLTVKALTPRTLAANQALELWLLPEGGKPVSLGLMPVSGSKQSTLLSAVQKQFANTPAVAVSLEPAGGSPTGQPTGPVLYQAPLIHS